MSFMQKQIERFEAWQVETTCGTECVPCDLATSAHQSPQYIEGKLLRESLEFAERVTGWFCRLSAPGYIDCTEWSGPHDTEAEALASLDEMYPDDESEA